MIIVVKSFPTSRARLARALLAAAGLASVSSSGALSQNSLVERESAGDPRMQQFAERAAPRGGYQYWVQVGSYKDEATSRAEWERMRSTAESVLANIGDGTQRADLGARGIYYRVQLGPFASPGEAGQFCAQLKAYHIDCFLAAPEAVTTSTPPVELPRKTAPPVARPKPAAKPAEPKPVAKPAEPGMAPVEKPKDVTAAPKAPEPDTPALPDQRSPGNSSAEKPDAPMSTAPGLPGVLDD